MLSCVAVLGSCDTDSGQTGVPDAPTSLNTSDIYFDGATLAWRAVPDVSTYRVRINGGTAFDVRSTVHVATGLTAQTLHRWEVCSVRGENTSEWVEGPAFTTSEISLAPPRNLTVNYLNPYGALLRWDEFPLDCSYRIRVQGEFNDEDYVIDEMIDVLTGEFTETWDKSEGAGVDMRPIMFPQKTYTWQVAVVIDKQQSAWAEGPAFTTKRPFTVEDFSGAYLASGVPSYLPAPGASAWDGEIVAEVDTGDDSMGWLLVHNCFGSTDNRTYALLDYEKEFQGIFLNGYNAVPVEYEGQTVNAFQIGLTYVEDRLLMWGAGEWEAEVDWNADTGTIAYPTHAVLNGYEEYGELEIMYGLATPDKSGYPLPVTEFYKDVVLTMDRSGNSRGATFGGTKVDTDRIVNRKGLTPVSAVSSTAAQKSVHKIIKPEQKWER